MKNIPNKPYSKDACNAESIVLAYNEAIKTYDWALRRFDAWDGNLDKILAWGSPISILAIGKILSNDAAGHFPHLFCIVIASVLTALAMLSAFCGKQSGKIDLIDPAKKFAAWLKLDPEAYRWYAIQDAGNAQQKNDEIVLRKANLATISVVFFALSAIVSALTWIV